MFIKEAFYYVPPEIILAPPPLTPAAAKATSHLWTLADTCRSNLTGLHAAHAANLLCLLMQTFGDPVHLPVLLSPQARSREQFVSLETGVNGYIFHVPMFLRDGRSSSFRVYNFCLCVCLHYPQFLYSCLFRRHTECLI